jgi:hypothetical protein
MVGLLAAAPSLQDRGRLFAELWMNSEGLDDGPTLASVHSVPDAVDGSQEVDTVLAKPVVPDEGKQVVVVLPGGKSAKYCC